MTIFPTGEAKYRRQLCEAFGKRRMELSKGLFLAIRDAKSATWKHEQNFNDVAEWGKSQLLTAVDLFTKWLETQEPLFQELFLGWVQSRLAGSLSKEAVPEDYNPAKVIEKTKALWIQTLILGRRSSAIQILSEDLDYCGSLLAVQPLKHVRVLFIGDCLQFEVITALMGPCTKSQIKISPAILNERVQPVLRNRIRAFRPDQFDLVFFSPFSHRYLPEYENLLKPKGAFLSESNKALYLDQSLKDVFATVDTLVSHFECKTYVHNTAGTIQSFGKCSGFFKNLVSWKNRKRARNTINKVVGDYLGGSRISLESRALLLDEDSLRRQTSDFRLGQIYVNSFAFHPTRLGIALGRGPCYEVIYAAAHLVGKKVVVCDLDNTLWNGVIGEGPVTHFLERQQLLKELKMRGILLSINSKNDPKRVHWSDAHLQATDFVAPQINWNSKVSNMTRIRDELNLKLKDFVFIDDRPDELERMRNAFPEVHALNASEAVTWRFISHWQRSLPVNQDRTKLYHERVEREQFVRNFSQGVSEVEDEGSALKGLQLSIRIKEAGRPDIKRAVELINRTNQFNLCGTRTTIRELQEGLGSFRSLITAEASDRFGSIGTVGVMLVEWKPDRIEIPIFVLSCRVFGFGIEYALLNALKKAVCEDLEVVGHYKETPFNEPCRKLYSNSGMSWQGEFWIGKVSGLPPDPAWLSIQNQMPAQLSTALSN